MHVVINNAGTVRPAGFADMSFEDFKDVVDVVIYGTYKVCRAAWPIFRKQKFGRIISTTSVEIYGNTNQSNYISAKSGMIGLSETLAKEGSKYNITSNVVSPINASRLIENVLPADIREQLGCEYVVPLVAYLAHADTKDTYGLYELGGGFFNKVRWERSKGSLWKTDDSFTSSAVLKNWNKVMDFTNAEHPTQSSNFLVHTENGLKLGSAAQGEEVSFRGQVVIVTGSGAGIGRAYALHLAKQGAKVVVNDFVNPDDVVAEIKAAGGIAVGDKSNIVDGSHVVKTAIDAFGEIHAVINNAGILRDKSFANITDEQWTQVLDVHLFGTFSVTKAAWPYLVKQKYGRIVNVTSTSGIYGNFGQSNYASAKTGIIGLSAALAFEGQKHNIRVNTIAPSASTGMTKSIFTEEMFNTFKPEYVAPLVTLLASEKCPETSKIFEVGSGWIGATRYQRSGGFSFTSTVVTPEDVKENWDKICDFDDGRAKYPTSISDASSVIIAASGAKKRSDPLKQVARGNYSFKTPDAILYNLAIGAKATELKYSFEGSPDFEVLPSIGVIPSFKASLDVKNLVPNFDPRMLLHAEQYLEVRKYPIPTSGNWAVVVRPLQILDKGKAAVVYAENCIIDKATGEEVFYNVSSSFIRGSGNNGGPRDLNIKGALTAANDPPSRAPDFVSEYKVNEEQAAFYRLTGDFNPLHIDPAFSSVGGFPKPILHGLCFFGITARLLYNQFGKYKNIKVRFAGHVLMGETLRVEAWKEGNRVIFQTKVKDRNTYAIKAAALELLDEGNSKI